MIKIIVGENDLATTHPELAKQWHPTKNGELTPQKVTAGSNRNIWWICAKGHEWHSRVNHRRDGIGCPYCSGQRAIPGENDLATVNKELAAQWHPTKNTKSPSEVLPYCNDKVWWVCSEGHEWEARINGRSRGKGCPYCSGRKATKDNNLKVVYPELMEEWHPTKNGTLDPAELTTRCDKKVWWRCKICDYEWQTNVHVRTTGHGCPACAGNVAIPGKNDLATVNPDLALEFHKTKNAELTPQLIAAYSNKKVWWKGKCGHEWQTTVSSRNQGGGCPICSNQKVEKGINDLATTNPELAKQWHPYKNGKKTAFDVTEGSNKKAWWKCSKCGYEWEAVIHSRRKSYDCPLCNASKGENLIRDYLDNNGLEFIYQNKFADLLGCGGQPLSYDFAVHKDGKILLLIEYQGSQHYNIKFDNNDEDLKKQQEHDRRKKEYANKKNIPLVEINYKYDTYDKIKSILDTYCLIHFRELTC